jgi:hypothetical protein
MPAQKVKVEIKAIKPNILGVLCTTFKAVEVGQGGNKRVKYRMHDSKTALSGTVELKHPGKNGLVSVLGINSNTKVVFSSLRRLKKA